jgi:hypothetical protein
MSYVHVFQMLSIWQDKMKIEVKSYSILSIVHMASLDEYFFKDLVIQCFILKEYV